MSGIVLSAATRQSLLSAQDTASLLAQTQNRLATGKKVTSALDNPLNFFTASSLDSRANDLSTLLDAVSNGVQTIQAASTGITNIQKLVDSAKSTANQALSTTLSTSGTATTAFGAANTVVAGAVTAGSESGSAVGTLTGSSALTGTGLALASGDAITINGKTINVTAASSPAVVGTTSGTALGSLTTSSLLNASPLSLTAGNTVTVGSKTVTITAATSGLQDTTHVRADDAISNLVSALNAGNTSASIAFDNASHTFTATSTDNTGAAQVSVGSDQVTNLGFTSAQASSNATTGSAGGLSDTTHIRANDTITNLVAKFNATSGFAATLAFSDTTHRFTLTSTDATGATNVNVGADSATKLGFTSAQASTNASTGVGTTKGSLTAGATAAFKVNGVAVSVALASGDTAAQAVTKLNAGTGVPSGTFSVDANGKIAISTSADVEITDAATKTALGFSGAAGVQSTELTVTGADTRANLAAQYNALLTQIDQLAGDASYNGVNLLNSSATSNKLHLSFNEKDTSNLDVQGVNAKSAGLNLTGIDTTAGGTGNFLTDTDISSTITKLTAATTTLRGYSSTFGSNLTVVQNRQDFSKNLINVLQTGSAGLTNADLNEEAANSQALSTRQSLAISALSLANTAQQNVLQLLR